MRAMMRMLSTTARLSVSSMPTLVSELPGGPMRYGTTYMVRPVMAPSNSADILA